MSDSDVKLVKVDNWGIYFLQRLKHFFNRTDYCDLTLQFQDNAQLKVHRLVLSACTEYFELLERTCEMYEDCLVMPDDLQADVVVPIVNFMYTGQLEFRMDLLERLYLTSQIMDMPVLTKLLDAHRQQAVAAPVIKPNNIKRSYAKPREQSAASSTYSGIKSATSSNSSTKRAYSTAFGNSKSNKSIVHKPDMNINNGIPPPYISPAADSIPNYSRKTKLGEPRPTRYELPEELDSDNLFDNSFTNISYTSQPLMVHPDSSKYYSLKKVFNDSPGSRGLRAGTSTLEIVECKKISKSDNIFEDDTNNDVGDEADLFQLGNTSDKVTNQLFDQIVEPNDGTKVTIETKDAKQAGNLDHAKIISEVLKKYPHLVKSNKNIKLKILNTPSPTVSKPPPKSKKQPTHQVKIPQDVKPKPEEGYTYESDVLDSKEAAKLIALGAENVNGPWICLICGTPGKAIHFTSYYQFRRHLVEVHNEKPVSNMCEYCGLKSPKRNYLLHHLLVKHGVEPPPSYSFPKCNQCSYIALTEGFLVKHKLSHQVVQVNNFRCNVCNASYSTSQQLLSHIQCTGHKYSSENKKPNLQCIYCMKVFMRETNFYAHLKTLHKQAAKNDGIIDDSDDERAPQFQTNLNIIKYEPKTDDDEEMETQYQITPDGNIDVIQSKKRVAVATSTPTKQKILNSGFGPVGQKPVTKTKPQQNIQEEFQEEVVMIDNTEYVMRENQLVPKKKSEPEYVISDITPSETSSPSTSMEYSNIQNPITAEGAQANMTIKKAANVNQPIQIVVSNEEEYKALMNSNHSIIFDDGDANKTLTVLSTPDTALNPTGLDLDTNQSSDMMIIPESYPLNVSEALPANNSNIVVVYGHSVDQQDKQFQIITSQDLAPQYVQSPAVITQNFGTLTTSAPVMSAHVIDAQDAQPWPDNDQNNQQVAQMPELAEMTVIQTHEMATSASNTLNDLPEVTLTPTEPEIITRENVLQEVDQPIVITGNINESMEQQKEPKDTLTPMDVDENTETIIGATQVVIDNGLVGDSTADTGHEQQILTGNPPIQDNDTETDNIADKEDQLINSEQELNNEESEEELPETNAEDVVLESTDAANIEEQNSGEQIIAEDEDGLEPDDVVHAQEVTEDDKAIPEIAKEQIQSLTADWSEDEYDVEGQEQVEQEPDDNITNSGREAIAENEPQEVVESIESIQQEVEKQMNVVPERTVDVEDEVEGNDLSDVPDKETSVTAPKAPQEKISSLLNDWDENDSQEENNSVGEGDDSVTNNGTAAANIEVLKDVEGHNNPKKDDKIQSLVSDWDDDEEEGKS